MGKHILVKNNSKTGVPPERKADLIPFRRKGFEAMTGAPSGSGKIRLKSHDMYESSDMMVEGHGERKLGNLYSFAMI